MTKEEIERAFSNAGWDIDGGFAGYLLIGYNRDSLSVLAYEEVCQTDDDPVFEIIDHERNLPYGVQEIPSPQQARDLLRQHGQPPEGWDE